MCAGKSEGASYGMKPLTLGGLTETGLLLALFGPHAMSDLSAECVLKRTSAGRSEFFVGALVNAPPEGSRPPPMGETPDRRGWWRVFCNSPRASTIPTAFSPGQNTCREPDDRPPAAVRDIEVVDRSLAHLRHHGLCLVGAGGGDGAEIVTDRGIDGGLRHGRHPGGPPG